MSRYPWRKGHIPFLLAHAGILILLFGSWVTEFRGVDGNLRVSEGETVSVVDLDTAALMFAEKNRVHALPIPWLPPEVTFRPFEVSAVGLPYDIRIDQYLSHADPLVSFVPNPDLSTPKPGEPPRPLSGAAQIRVEGGPMNISQEIWLWEGAPGWQSFQAGPAQFALGINPPVVPGQPQFVMHREKNGQLTYVARTREGKTVRGKLNRGSKVQPGWKGGVSVTLVEWVPDAVASTSYRSARIQHGPQAPTSAIHLIAGKTVGVWLGYGDRAVIHLDPQEIEVSYFPRRIFLPFSIRLDHFTIEHDQGTSNPAAYSSRVTVLDGPGPSSREALVSMNEPLDAQGYTVYQASYEDGDPRPVTSIFAVNRDPGRIWKYLGSALLVLGSVLMFAAKYRRKKNAMKVSPQTESVLTHASEAPVL